MSIVKINAITVPADSGDELARRFASRAGAVDGQPGFEGFELLQPTDGRNVWLVVTRWADEESFEAWKNSASFGRRSSNDSKPGALDTLPARLANRRSNSSKRSRGTVMALIFTMLTRVSLAVAAPPVPRRGRAARRA